MKSRISNSQIIEDEILINKNRLDYVLNSLESATWEMDLVTKESWISPQHKKIFGYSKLLKEWTFDIFLENVVPEDKEMVNEIYKEAVSTISDWNFECRIKRKDGLVRWICSKGRYEVSKDNKSNKMFGIIQDITEKKLSEEELRDSEQKYKSLYENAPLSYQSLNGDGSFRDVNPRWLQTLGYEREEVIGKKYIDFLHPDWQEHFKKNFPAFKKRGYVSDVQFKLRHKAGHYIDISFEGCIGYNPDGSFRQTYCVFQDITSRLKAENELRMSEERFRILYNNSPDMYVSVSPEDSSIIMCNDTLLKNIGYSREEVIGRSIFTMYHDDCMEEANKAFLQFSQTGEVNNRELVLKRKDGSKLDVSLKVYAVRDDSGKILHSMSSWRDITERKQAEKELNKQKEMFELVINSIPIRIFWKDLSLNYLGCNQAFADASGQKKIEAVIGKNDFDLIWGKEAEKYIYDDKHVINSGISKISYEEDYTTPDGENIWWNTNKIPLRDYNGEIFGVLATAEDITKRKLAEEKIRAAEGNLKSTFDLSPSIICKANLDTGFFIEANQAVTRILGYSVEEFTSIPFIEMIHSDDHQNSSDEKDEQRKGKDVTFFENRYLCKDGSYKWLAWHGTKADENGIVMAVGSDINEHKLAQIKLNQSTQLLEASQAVAKLGGWELDISTNNLFWTAETYRIHDTSPDEFNPTVDAGVSYFLPESRRIISDALESAIKDGKGYDLELETLTTKGRLIQVRTTCEVTLKDGHPAELIGIFQDITDRKKAEEQLRKTESLQYKMVANIDDVIVITDKDGITRYKSPNIEHLFGWKPEELVGISTFNNVHPLDLEGVRQFVADLTVKPKATGTTELRYKCKNGSYKWISLTIVNMFHDPDINGLLGNYHDISDSKTKEEEQLNLRSQLQQAQKMESVGRLAGGVAHDFNNMLGVILGHTEMLMEKTNLDQRTYTSLEEIRKAGESSAELTKQLLAFARKQTVSPKVLDLNLAVEGILNMLHRLIGEDISLIWQPGKNGMMVNLDPSQLDQMLANLCVNARDAINEIGKITIETDNVSFDEVYCLNHPGSVPGEFVMLGVSDDGGGMDKDTQANIFEPFYTTKELGKGTGLGLSTIYGIVKQNNGFIDVFSEPGQGSTFKIYLPRQIRKTNQMIETAADKQDVRGHETILLVEDEESILRMTTMMLEQMGYTVVATRSPGEAIQLVANSTETIHLLMTDVIMPEMNGRDLAKNLLTHYPNINRLFMSGYTADIIAHHGVLNKGVHFIQKPFSVKDLSAKVREALDNT